MARIQLQYGRSEIPLDYDENRFQVLQPSGGSPTALSDAEIGARLEDPIDSPPLEEVVSPGETVMIVVPDATRQTAAGQVVNLVVRRLIVAGIPAHDIRIIFATGIHRKVSDEEKRAILTSFIAQRIKTLDHDPRDLARIVRVGETTGGIPIELDRAIFEHHRVVIVGGISFHYFAGFTGGRKLICPGLASAKTISETHKLAFDCETKARRYGVETGRLDGNAVHEAFMEAVAKIDPSFAINAIVNDAGEAVDLFCGNWITSHRSACEHYGAAKTIQLAKKRDLVLVSCGGSPHDINMIQAHKALEAASRCCTDGGTIVFLAECPDGLGRKDFLDWFDCENSGSLANRLCENYQVNGQTAWSLLKTTERFDVRMVTSLDESACTKMRMRKIEVSFITELSNERREGYILPFGSKLRTVLDPISSQRTFLRSSRSGS
ncbi:MAG: nickel-dependent lactate racemase [Acidobacteriota bacterium]